MNTEGVLKLPEQLLTGPCHFHGNKTGGRWPLHPMSQYPQNMESTKNDTKSDPCNSTVLNSLPAECEAAGHGFIPPPVPPFRGTRDPVFSGDPRSQVMRRDPLFPPPPPANICEGSPDYFPPRDFDSPPFAPFPERNVYVQRGFPPYTRIRLLLGMPTLSGHSLSFPLPLDTAIQQIFSIRLHFGSYICVISSFKGEGSQYH